MHYWSLPSVIQKVVAMCVPKKNTWKIKAVKAASMEWLFDIKPFITDEAITGGTESIIDCYFLHINGCPPNLGDSITIEATTVKPAYHHAVCHKFEETDGFGHSFIEQNTQMQGWLCPVLEVMFGKVPDAIYVTFS